jgi:hypothetical protein
MPACTHTLPKMTLLDVAAAPYELTIKEAEEHLRLIYNNGYSESLASVTLLQGNEGRVL